MSRFSVDGTDSLGSLDSEGTASPFVVFDEIQQDWLPAFFKHRWQARIIAWVFNQTWKNWP